MIHHNPYGNDDPYRPQPTERSPRDPSSDDIIQIRFQAEAVEEAWVECMGQRYGAQALGDGYWLSLLGPLKPGNHSYTIVARSQVSTHQAGPFECAVGEWMEAERCVGIHAEPQGLRLELQSTDGSSASFGLSIPQPGVCRAVFAVGEAAKPSGLACFIAQHHNQVRVSAGGIEVQINTEKLVWKVEGPKGTFHGSLRFRWLQLPGGVIKLQTSFSPQPHEALYGLGERFEGSNHRGKQLDVRVYEEYKEQGNHTYLPVPFLVSTASYGVWLEAEEPSFFDLGEPCVLSLEKLLSQPAELILNILVADEPYGVTALFTKLTGAIAVPPKWAFGPWMSANTWNSQVKAEVEIRRTVAEDVPATVLVLEAWSDETTFYIFNDAAYQPKSGSQALSEGEFKYQGRWPNPKSLIEECNRHSIHVLLWQIPVLKHTSDSNPQHDADIAYAIEQGYIIQNADGSPYRNKGWWFTDSYILDFSNPKAREWWFAKRKYLLDLGVEGFKTDGGEHLWGRDLHANDGRRGLQLFNAYPNTYIGAYHDFLGGKGMTFSRSGYTGAQKYPAHWAGDENSTWAAFKASVLAGLSAGVSGVSMWGWDIGGFSGEIPTVELYLRSTAMAAFCPIMQYHSELHWSSDNRERTPWNIAERQGDSKALNVYRFYAQLRMRLLDYIYAEAQALSAVGLPLMRYPALEYPTAHDFLAADAYAYLFGRDLLVAPVVEKGVMTREVRLPPGQWVYLWSGAVFEGLQTLVVPAPLERIPVFVQADSPRLKELLRVAQNG